MVLDNYFIIIFCNDILKVGLITLFSLCVLMLLKVAVATKQDHISVVLKEMSSKEENNMSIFWVFLETYPQHPK